MFVQEIKIKENGFLIARPMKQTLITKKMYFGKEKKQYRKKGQN